jgi:signal transduction histidine kinase
MEQVASAARLRSYPLVALIEQNVDLTFARLRQANSRSRRELVALEGKALRILGGLLLAIPAFVVAAVVYLSRSVARPLARLSEGAAAVAAGNLDAQIDVDSPDEFGALAAEFNAMTTSLRLHQARLVEAEKLAAIGRLAAGVAHELNNPLQVMLGYLSRNRDLPDPRLARELAATEAEARRCKAIVEDLLELSRPPVTPQAVDLRSLCQDVASGLQVAQVPAAASIALHGEALALGEPPKLRQVLLNLMKNALEAAGPEGQVEVRLRSAGAQVEVAVRDSGPGVPPEVRARLFEPFYSTKPNGTGLGLAVSRALAKSHGGDIDVASGAAGGAVFTLRLPRAPERRT